MLDNTDMEYFPLQKALLDCADLEQSMSLDILSVTNAANRVAFSNQIHSCIFFLLGGDAKFT